MRRGLLQRTSSVTTALVLWTLSSGVFADPPPPAEKPAHPGALVGADAAEAMQLDNEIRQQREAGEWQEAAATAQRLLELRRSKQGEKHWETVNASWLSRTMELLATKPQEVAREYQVAGKASADAQSLYARSKFAEAQPLYEQGLTVFSEILGTDHPYTATRASDLALNFDAQGKYDKAQALFESAIETSTRLLGEHPEAATIAENFAAHEFAQGKNAEAAVLFERTLNIRRQLLGDDHPETAISYINSGANLNVMGRFATAQLLFETALDNLGRRGEDERPTALGAYNNLASSLNQQGKYAAAQPVMEKVLEVCRHILGDQHTNTAVCYNNLASNLASQYRYAESHALFEKALEIWKPLLGENHQNVAGVYHNLAFNLFAQGKYREAQPLDEMSLAIYKRVLGDDRPETARVYGTIAGNLIAQSSYSEALPISEKVLAIRLRVFGDEHPESAIAYNDLALNLYALGRHDEARLLFEKALDIRKRLLGNSHPDTAFSYSIVAVCLGAVGEYDRAWTFFQEAKRSFDEARTLAAFSGQDRSQWAAKHESGRRSASCIGAHLGYWTESWQALENGLGRGLWDDISLSASNVLTDEERKALGAAERELQRLDQALATGKLPDETREKFLQDRSTASIQLGELRSQVMQKYGPQGGQVLELPAVQEALSEDTALVAWIDTKPVPKAADPDGDHWAVVVRKSGEPVWIDLPGTGEKDQWTETDFALPGKLRDALKSPSGDWPALAKSLRRQRLVPLQKALGPTSDGLPAVSHLVVLPSSMLAGIPIEVLREPDDAWTVSYSPSATLYAWLRTRKPSAEQSPTGLLALGDPVFREAGAPSSEQALPPHGLLITTVVPQANAAGAGLKAGDVLLAYNQTPLKEFADLKAVPESEETKAVAVPVEVWREGQKVERELRPGKLGVVLAREPAPLALKKQRELEAILVTARSGSDVFQPLPATAWEIGSLARRFQKAGQPVQALLGLAASEPAVNTLALSGELAKYRYLHLASHGVIDDQYPQRSAVIVTQVNLPDALEAALKHEPIIDGRISVEEIRARWKLRADLVTLSACQTALGKQEGGEGFVGFTQALLLAGAETVCLSLWEVDDTATALLMDRFYGNLLGQREGLKKPLAKGPALAEAQAWLRTLTAAQVSERTAALTKGLSRGAGHKTQILDPPKLPGNKTRSARPYEHPYYWAAFILAGRSE